MFCHNCGTQLDENAIFCPSCGAKKGSKVIDLPKNYNFLLVLLLLIAVMISCAAYLMIYRINHDYKDGFEYQDNIYYYPFGFSAKAGDKEEVKDCVFITDSSIQYQLCYEGISFDKSIVNDYELLKLYFQKQEYKIININRYNDKLLITHLETGIEGCSYHFIYNYHDNEDVIKGYIYTNNQVTNKEFDTLYEILSHVKSK